MAEHDASALAALVTGGGAGIGRAVAAELARRGMAVCLHYAGNADGAEAARAEIEAAGGRCVVVQADLADASACRRVVDEAVARLGRLDVLVNNAAVTRATPFLEVGDAEFDELVALNLRGYFVCSQQAARHFRAHGGGSIVNVTSVHALRGLPLHSAYAATKGGVVALTRQLAIELAPHRIRVNAVAPGVIDVPRYRVDMPDFDADAAAEQIPLGRVGTPADVAQIVGMLAGAESAFVTGETVTVDGGTAARLALDPERFT